MASSNTVVMKPPRKRRLVEGLLSGVVAVVVSGTMLWNWDGFWQTEVPLLAAVQETYFPVKHAQENDKLANTRTNTVRWAEALRKIEVLEADNEKLRMALQMSGGMQGDRR